MTRSFSIGRLLGSDIRIHPTFFLLLAWVGYSAFAQGGLAVALVNLAFVLALFACVLAHEFGHALMARRYGVQTPDITLLPIGGLARLTRIPARPSAEIAVALAGPAVNVVIWAVLTGLLGATSDFSALARLGDPTASFVGQLAALNLFLVLFNMIPAFPMDGGRVLRALLALRMDRRRATVIAARAGQVLALGFAGWGIATVQPLLLLIAAFVFLAARAELRAVRRALAATPSWPGRA